MLLSERLQRFQQVWISQTDELKVSDRAPVLLNS